MPKRTEPNFLLGGTSAGGTSFLSAILLQHPQIYHHTKDLDMEMS